MTQISLITIGSELLKGRIINTNASDIGRMLRPRGYTLARTVVIPDTREAIVRAVTEEMDQHDVVLMSGGLGPTEDDITKSTLADLFECEQVLHEPTLAHITDLFEKRGRKITDRNRQQAMVPTACEVIFNPKGTAPGMMFKKGNKRLFSMPGVPFEMKRMMDHEVIPRIQQAYPLGFYAHNIIRIYHIPESDAADRMRTIYADLPQEVDIAYLPRIDGIWLELSLQSNGNPTEAQERLDQATERVYELFKDKFYARGEKVLPAILGEALMEKGLTIAVAESLTGGELASSLVSVSGSSRYFKGSVTAYDPSIKTQVLNVPEEMIQTHTVVSEPVVKTMAEQVRLLMQADIGIATTGIAERDGDIMPRAWLGYADAHETLARHVSLFTDRNTNIRRCAQYAMQLCLKKVRTRIE